MKWVGLIVAVLVGFSAGSTSAQSFADSVSASLYMLGQVDRDRVGVPMATRVLCFPNTGGRIWPDSVRGGEAFDTQPMSDQLYAAVADSLTARFDLPTVPVCEDNGPGYRIDEDGRQAVLVGLSAPIFITPDSAVANVGFSAVGWESFGWTCRLRRTTTSWEVTSPCLESWVQR